MSLAIDIDLVSEVLLLDGRWYGVAEASFLMDAYEYLWWPEGVEKRSLDFQVAFSGGQSSEIVSSTGASWVDDEGLRYFCPVSSIVAVRYRSGS
jgi:hypothetical protein